MKRNIKRVLALTAVTMVGLGAGAPAASADEDDVTPVFECAAPNSDGTFTAFFGYKNGDDDDDYRILIGSNNQFTPSPKYRGQPLLFEPGRHVAVFAIKVDAKDKPQWHLGGGKATVDTTKLCAPPAELSETSSLLALPLASLGSIGLWFGIQRRRKGAGTPPATPAVA